MSVRGELVALLESDLYTRVRTGDRCLVYRSPLNLLAVLWGRPNDPGCALYHLVSGRHRIYAMVDRGACVDWLDGAML